MDEWPGVCALAVKGFKGLDVHLDKMADFNVIIGENNSGKSSLATALRYYARLGVGGHEQHPFLGINTGDFKSYAASLLSPPNNATIEVSVRARRTVRSSAPAKCIRTHATLTATGFSGSQKIEGVVQREDVNVEDIKNIIEDGITYFGPFEHLGEIGLINTVDKALLKNGHNLATILFSLNVNDWKRYELIEKTFARVVPEYPHIRTLVNGVPPTAEVRLELQGGNTHALREIGEGIARALCLIVGMCTSREGGLVILEEPELGMHPRLQRKLLSALRDVASARNQQLLILTHSPTWAAQTPETKIWRMTKGTAVPITDVSAIRESVGARPSDYGFLEGVLLAEGDSEGMALPILAEGAGFSLASLGIYLAPLGSSSKENRVKSEVDLANNLGQKAFLALDGADMGGRPSERVAQDFGIARERLFLWSRADGNPGEIEDIYPVAVVAEALTSIAFDESHKVSFTGEEIEQALTKHADKKTSKVLGDLYYEKVRQGWSKPDFNAEAARICVERDAVPVQVRDMLTAISDVLADG